MKERDIYIEFERSISLINPELSLKNKLTSETILSILNQAIDKFIVTRFTGVNFKRESFELTQKRIDDLHTLVTTKNLAITEDVTLNADKIYKVIFPSDYMFMLGDTAYISPITKEAQKCWPKDEYDNYKVLRTDTLEGTVETLDRMLSNSLSEHILRYNKARPIKLITLDGVVMYTDGSYEVTAYQMVFLRKPKKLTLNSLTQEYTDLPEHTIREIVKLATGLYMSTLNDERYNSINGEIATME